MVGFWQKDDVKKFMDAAQIPNDGTTYFAATPYEITGAEYHRAMVNLVSAFKDLGIFSPNWHGYNSSVHQKLFCYYPMIGGTATSTKFNLCNPLDTNAAHRINWFGGMTFDGGGAIPNGTNAYGLTYFYGGTTDGNLDFNKDYTIGFYDNDANTTTGYEYFLGRLQGNMNVVMANNLSIGKLYNQDIADPVVRNILSPSSGSLADARGSNLAVRNGLSSFKTYNRGVNVYADTDTVSTNNVSDIFLLFSRNNNGSIDSLSKRRAASIVIASAFSDAQAIAFSTAEQDFQTALHREV